MESTQPEHDSLFDLDTRCYGKVVEARLYNKNDNTEFPRFELDWRSLDGFHTQFMVSTMELVHAEAINKIIQRTKKHAKPVYIFAVLTHLRTHTHDAYIHARLKEIKRVFVEGTEIPIHLL